ncbi:hypothetical protein T492DRAFT_833079 [Pavlovales sp. CCMP2436]|nr:hypothetical protein T492DRAFT_833079 [Pavlovales sp. CCMP2436]
MRTHRYPVHSGVEGACARLVADGDSPEAVARSLAAVLADCAIDEEEPPFAVEIVPAGDEGCERGLACELRVTPSGVIFIGPERPRRLDELELVIMLGGAFQPASALAERSDLGLDRRGSRDLGGDAEEDDEAYGVQLRWLDGTVHTLRASGDGEDEDDAHPDEEGPPAAALAAEQLQELFEAHLVRFAHMRAALLVSLRHATSSLEPADERAARTALKAQLAAVWAPLSEAAASVLRTAPVPDFEGEVDAKISHAGFVVASGAVPDRMRLLGLGR